MPTKSLFLTFLAWSNTFAIMFGRTTPLYVAAFSAQRMRRRPFLVSQRATTASLFSSVSGLQKDEAANSPSDRRESAAGGVSVQFNNDTIGEELDKMLREDRNGAPYIPPTKPQAPAFDVLLAIDPSDIEIGYGSSSNSTDSMEETFDPNLMRQLPFVNMFRGSANYIANHRGTTAVYHVPGGLLDLPDPHIFRDLMNDIALTWLLGMKIVLVVGCRHQIEKRIDRTNRSHGLRVTDKETLRIVKEEAGYVRFEVERQLARALRMQGGSGGQGSAANFDGNVVSGNFYSAQPFGILDGVDYQFTGFVRRVEADKIKQLHANRDICLLTTLGVSPSGEVFNVNSECLAACVAGALQASKVIYFTEKDMELRHRVHRNKIQSLRMSDARALVDHYGIQCDAKGFVTECRDDHIDKHTKDMLLRIGWGSLALKQGVKRAHIISPKFGAVLQELYTRDGSGTLVSGDLYEGIRRATVHDVALIYDLISPLIQAGTLIDRPKATLEQDIDAYYVYTRDNSIVACGQLKLFEDGFAEIGCLVVSKDFRSNGRGDAMLGYLERLALMNGSSSIFVLSTQTMEWFLERGFDAAVVEQLPKSRQASYNHKRASKIYLKKIENPRDLDASELWWNR